MGMRVLAVVIGSQRAPSKAVCTARRVSIIIHARIQVGPSSVNFLSNLMYLADRDIAHM